MPKHEPQQSSLVGSAGWQQLESLVRKRLDDRQQTGRHRELRTRPTMLDASWLDLTHNDYLGLGQSRSFQELVRLGCQEIPVGASASRLLGGEHAVYQVLEASWSEFKNAESSLFVSSGYAANEIIGSLLSLAECWIFSDELNHASIIDGIRLGSLPKNQRKIFKHNDLDDLERQLQISQAPLNIIWTESVFSMDGDFAPLTEMQALAEKYRGILVVDEAHALGCYGPNGEGLLAELALDPTRIITINPCGKAVAAAGALITAPTWFRDYIINFARPFIYSTGPSPWLAKAVLIAIQHFQNMDAERQHLKSLADRLRLGLQNLGLDTGRSQSHIIPVIVGDEQQALDLEACLKENRILAKAVRPPTVAIDSCRIRLSLHTRLSMQNIDNIIEVFRKWQTKVS